MSRRSRGVVAAGALCLTAGLAPVVSAGGGLPVVGVTAVPVGVFATPTYLTWAPGDPAAVYVTERAGTIRRAVGSSAAATIFLNLTGQVSVSGEGGLLSVAFPPDHATSGLFYVYIANTSLDIEIVEFRRSAANPNLADPASRRSVLVINHRAFTNHYGGQLQFGPDGYLYIGTGDGGGGGDPLGSGQNLNTLLGKMLRIDPKKSGTSAYTIPATNPFIATPGARPEIWAYGLRNPWRFSFDRATGDLTIGDVGQSTREEVDYAPVSTGAGANYGWNIFEGTFQFRPGNLPNHTPPVLERPRNAGFCTSITGGYVVHDPGLPSLTGDYLYGDYCVGTIRAARLQLPQATNDRPLNANIPNLASFGEDTTGCLYAISLTGPIFRLIEDANSLTAPCAISSGLGPISSEPRGALCGMESASEPGAPGQVQVGTVHGGPLSTTTAAGIRLSCTVQVGTTGATHAGADAASASSPTGASAILAPAPISYLVPSGAPVYLCTAAVVAGDTLYHDAPNGAWSTSPGAGCKLVLFHEVDPTGAVTRGGGDDGTRAYAQPTCVHLGDAGTECLA